MLGFFPISGDPISGEVLTNIVATSSGDSVNISEGGIATIIGFTVSGGVVTIQETGFGSIKASGTSSGAVVQIFEHGAEIISTYIAASGGLVVQIFEGGSATQHLVALSGAKVSILETGIAANLGISAGVRVSISEFGQATMPMVAISFGEVIQIQEFGDASITVPTADVWVVNLYTGGHSRYQGDMTGATAVQASVVTGVSRLGYEYVKYVGLAHILARLDRSVTLSTVTDEYIEVSGYPVPFDRNPGLFLRKIRLSEGVKGVLWQFRLDSGGANCDIKSLKVIMTPTGLTK